MKGENWAIHIYEDAYGGAHGETEIYEAWSLLDTAGYGGGMNCSSDLFGGTVCAKAVDS